VAIERVGYPGDGALFAAVEYSEDVRSEARFHSAFVSDRPPISGLRSAGRPGQTVASKTTIFKLKEKQCILRNDFSGTKTHRYD